MDIILFYATRKIKFPCGIKFFKMFFWHQIKSSSKQMFEWLSRLCNLLFPPPQKNVFQNFCSTNKWMMLQIIEKSVFEIMTLPINLVLSCRFKDHNLVFCSLCMILETCVHVWSVKISTRILKYESRIVKSNPV